jgi:hypothetical protein
MRELPHSQTGKESVEPEWKHREEEVALGAASVSGPLTKQGQPLSRLFHPPPTEGI